MRAHPTDRFVHPRLPSLLVSGVIAFVSALTVTTTPASSQSHVIVQALKDQTTNKDQTARSMLANQKGI
ncbi:MAG: hypothetical protein KDC95_23745, partial [Planctomycetes bacterium]|nr:hypothetical protein [Planctomycetota bacterium]